MLAWPETEDKMPKLLARRNNRLKNYNYCDNGFYFVTICTNDRQELFGAIRRGAISCARNEYGNIAKKYWDEIPKHYPYTALDEYIIMPNHTCLAGRQVHGIICINNDQNGHYKRTQNIVSLRNDFGQIIPGSLGSIIRGYKIGVTKWFRNNTDISIVWQKSFHDHIIRNDTSLNEIREYIRNNPATWDKDENNINNYKVTGQVSLPSIG